MKITMRLVQGRPAGKRLTFAKGEYYFGRGAECHVRPNSDWVSRQHCLLRVTADGAYIRDLGSRNGTLVNGALLECERCLSHGDQIQIGPLVFEVLFDSTAAVTRPGAAARPVIGGSTAELTLPGGPPPSHDSTESHPILPALKPNKE